MCHLFLFKSSPAILQRPLSEVFMKVPCSVMRWKSTPTQYNTNWCDRSCIEGTHPA